MKIAVIGSTSIDMIVKTPHIPCIGDVVVGGQFSMATGGRGANQAVAATRAGAEVSLISRIGNDMFGERALNDLASENIILNHVHKDPDRPTGVDTIMVSDTGDTCVTVSPGSNMSLTEEDINQAKEVILSSDIILMQLEIPVETVKYAARLAKSEGKKVILNPSPALPISDDILKSISVLTPDAPEAELLTGINITDERSAELAGRILLERGLDRVIITMRTRGAMVIDNGGAEHVPSFKNKMVDAHAVNDVFNGVLAVALAEGKNFYEAVLFANAASSLSLARTGGQSAMPQRQEILDVMKSNKRSH